MSGADDDAHSVTVVGPVISVVGGQWLAAVDQDVGALLDGGLVIGSLRAGLCAAAGMAAEARRRMGGVIGVPVRLLGARSR